MKANFHTHTYRCNHAEGADRRYVESAIEAGVRVLGFSDHSPYVGFTDGFYSFYRMKPEELWDYVFEIGKLRDEYKNDIEIHIGLEAEYYPRLFPALLEFLRPYGIEYLILGQHYLDDDQNGMYVQWARDEEGIKKYTDQCIEGLNTGVFSYLAHPDIVGFNRMDPVFKREMGRLCDASNALGLPMEVNVLGVLRDRIYPCEEYLEVCREKGSRMIIGLDAHLPEQFTNKDPLMKAEKMIKDHSLCLTEEIDMTRLARYYATNSR
ncbi:MAG: PHP domain-containing protein [Ruminococcaceae bacterium]|nr:PHP domain-containing protein [Oscillospiraceae bacterium]